MGVRKVRNVPLHHRPPILNRMPELIRFQSPITMRNVDRLRYTGFCGGLAIRAIQLVGLSGPAVPTTSIG